MKYITGIHALNLTCALDTCGDWHQSAIQWTCPFIRESSDSIFRAYGIELNKQIPEHRETYNVANHIRACLDLLELGQFSLAQGMNRDFICNDKYNVEIFDHVMLLSKLPHWQEIDEFMGWEYYCKWLDYKKCITGESEAASNTEEPWCGSGKCTGTRDAWETAVANDKSTYGADTLCIRKNVAYAATGKIRDIFDIVYICENYFEQLSSSTITLLRESMGYDGAERFEYILRTQGNGGLDTGTVDIIFRFLQNISRMYPGNPGAW